MTTLRLRCDDCDRDVSGSKQAVIHILYADAMKARAEHDEDICNRDQWKAESLAELLANAPFEGHWQIHCDDCNPHPSPEGGWCEDCYWIGLDRCTTTERLLDWTAHLMGKNWFHATDWNDLIYRVLTMSGIKTGL